MQNIAVEWFVRLGADYGAASESIAARGGREKE